MSEKTITKKINLKDRPHRLSKEAQARLDALSDDDVARTATGDVDNPPMTPDELKQAQQVSFAKHVRLLLGLTQEAFAKAYGIPLGTLRDWEQHRTEPDQAAQSYLKVIAAMPEEVQKAAS